MIYYATPGHAALSPVAVAAEHQAATHYLTESTSLPPIDSTSGRVEGSEGEQAEIIPQVRDLVEEFNWDNKKVRQEFVQLEQKVLAKKANAEEMRRYKSMKRDRNSHIFADRYVRDYAEEQRLHNLSRKLAEIEQYLRPIRWS